MAGGGGSGLDLAGDLSMIFGVGLGKASGALIIFNVGLGKASGAMVINRTMIFVFLGVVS